MKVYIAGKITGNDNCCEEFSIAERKLRALGHIPLNPALLPVGMEKADYMRICTAMLDSADAIALLPSWTHSNGAAIELGLARYTGKDIIYTGEISDSKANNTNKETCKIKRMTYRDADGSALMAKRGLFRALGVCELAAYEDMCERLGMDRREIEQAVKNVSGDEFCIIRCRDCTNHIDGLCMFFSGPGCVYTKDNDYCSYGEQRDVTDDAAD